MPVINVNHFSIRLKRNNDCIVIIPDELEKDEKLKCLWLYYDSENDNNEYEFRHLAMDKANEKHIAVVIVDKVYCTNEKYIQKELPKTIFSMFKCISSNSEDNYKENS